MATKKIIVEDMATEEYKINFNEYINVNNFEVSVNYLDAEQDLRTYGLINKYKSIFTKDKYAIATVTDYEARIDLSIDKYCSRKPYRCSVEDRQEIEDQISKLLKENIIEE